MLSVPLLYGDVTTEKLSDYQTTHQNGKQHTREAGMLVLGPKANFWPRECPALGLRPLIFNVLVLT